MYQTLCNLKSLVCVIKDGTVAYEHHIYMFAYTNSNTLSHVLFNKLKP